MKTPTADQLMDVLEVLESAYSYAAYVEEHNPDLHKEAAPTVLGSDQDFVPRLMDANLIVRGCLYPEPHPFGNRLVEIQEKEDFVTERAEQFLNRKYD